MTGKILFDNLHPDVVARFFQPDGVSIIAENGMLELEPSVLADIKEPKIKTKILQEVEILTVKESGLFSVVFDGSDILPKQLLYTALVSHMETSTHIYHNVYLMQDSAPSPANKDNGNIYSRSIVTQIDDTSQFVDSGWIHASTKEDILVLQDVITAHESLIAGVGVDGDLGHVKIDGITILSNDGVISVNPDSAGVNGKSAYDIAVENGFTGNETEWLESLKGQKGEQGIQGIEGSQGDMGMKGDQGIQGIQGFTGADGQDGEQGIQGQQGEQGTKGDMGDGFTISGTYPTISDMNAAFTTDGLPVGAFVIINSIDPDNDPDNSKVYVKTTTNYSFQSVLRGLKGETGSTGSQGIQGQQGEQGVKGDKGDQGAQGIKGADGKGVRIKGTLAHEYDLAPLVPTAQVGDAYWVEDDSRLWIFTDDLTVVASPTFLRSPSLRGSQGVQGIRGEKGDKGDAGVAPTLNDATKTSKGVMQVGNGLVVSSGVVSIEQVLRTNILPNTPLADIPNGVTESASIINGTDTTYIEFLRIVNETLGYTFPNEGIPFKFYFKNTKRSAMAVRQELTVVSNFTNSIGDEFFRLTRETSTTTGEWYPWRVDVSIIYGVVNPNNNVSATRGCLYFDYTTAMLYRKTTATAGGSSTGWISTQETLNPITTATVPKGASFNPNVYESKVTKQGMFTRLEMKFIHPSTPTTADGTTVTIGVIPSGFRPTGQPVFLKVEDNGGGSAQRNDIRIDTNGNIRWTPRVNTGNFTIAFSVVY